MYSYWRASTSSFVSRKKGTACEEGGDHERSTNEGRRAKSLATRRINYGAQLFSAEIPYIRGTEGTPSGGTIRLPRNSRIPEKRRSPLE